MERERTGPCHFKEQVSHAGCHCIIDLIQWKEAIALSQKNRKSPHERDEGLNKRFCGRHFMICLGIVLYAEQPWFGSKPLTRRR